VPSHCCFCSNLVCFSFFWLVLSTFGFWFCFYCLKFMCQLFMCVHHL
jgi:hypothetical protein